jgi:hypothetical protein
MGHDRGCRVDQGDRLVGLVSLGVGVNRLLQKSGDIPEPWRRAVDRLLGREDWFDAFYKVEPLLTLFGGEEQRVEKASIEVIDRYFNDRLKTVFAGVAGGADGAEKSANCPLYLLCFAAGNAKGAPIAVRIANYLLKKV